MAHASTSVTATVGQPGSSAAVASGSAPNSNPSSTPRTSHTHPPVNAIRDGAEAQGTSSPNSGKFDWHGDKMCVLFFHPEIRDDGCDGGSTDFLSVMTVQVTHLYVRLSRETQLHEGCSSIGIRGKHPRR